MYKLIRSETAIDEQLDRAAEAEKEGTAVPGMTYEQGVAEALRWALEEGYAPGDPIEER